MERETLIAERLHNLAGDLRALMSEAPAELEAELVEIIRDLERAAARAETLPT